MKKFFTLRILILLPFLLYIGTLGAQVTIGADSAPHEFSVLELVAQYKTGEYGGLRLPQMTTTQRDDLHVELLGDDSAYGLMIYNITIHCVEYWNSLKWVSLCTGQASITFPEGDPTQPNFPPEGEERGPFTPHDNPDCTAVNPPFTFDVISGTAYLHINVVDETTGQFYVIMDENPTALPRNGIVRITNNCTGEYKEFIFRQDPNTALCDAGLAAPVLLAIDNHTEICTGSAVNLYLDGISDGTGYVWTRSGVEVARDVNTYAATQTGAYKVYAGAIGCEIPPSSATLNVTRGTCSAPAQPSAISGSATVCFGATGLTYSVDNVSGVTYTWDLPTGWTQTAGGTTNSITVTAGTSGGTITVTPSMGGSNGTAQTLGVTVISAPAQPSSISGSATACSDATGLTYSVTNVSDVTYAWTLPTGWTQTAGTTTNSITVTAGTTGGNITVTPSNTCGNGTAQTLEVTVVNGPCVANSFTPNTNAVTVTVDADGAGSGTATKTLTFLTYNLGADPSLTPKQQMAYAGCPLDMTVFGGWYQWGRNHTDHTFRCDPLSPITSDTRFTTTQVTTSGTPDNSTQFIYSNANWLSTNVTTLWGDGSLNGNNSGSNNPCPMGYRVPTEHEWALLSWEGGDPTTTTGDQNTSISTAITLAPSGLYWVQVNNGLVNHTFTAGNMCGFALYEKTVWEANPIAVGGSLIDASAPTPLLFLPAAGNRNYSDGARLSVGTSGYYWSSSSTTNAYILNFFGTNVNATTYNGRANGLSVRCIAESCAAASIQSTTPALRDTTICSGGTATLTVNATGSVTYEWFNSSNASVGTNATFTTSAAGTYYCVVTPTCGGATANSGNFTVTVISAPAQPSSITGSATVCSGTTGLTYSVTNVAGVTYTWTLPTGWTQTAGTTTNSITVTAGTTGGNITVTPSNTCGNGTAQTLTVVVGGCVPNSFGNDVSKNVTVTVDADGAGSGTATTTLNFLTYNLGANPALTPKQQMAYPGCETDMAVFGGWYQWGRNNLAHTFRCDPLSPITSDSRFTTTQITTSGTPDNSTQFIYNYNDWLSPLNNTLWGNGSINNPASGSNNPCPTGYRVPTEHEWALLSWENGDPNTITGDYSSISTAITLAPSGLYWVQVNNGLVNHTFTTGNMCGYAIYEKSVWEANPVAVGGSLIDASAPTPLLFLPAAGSRLWSSGTRYTVGTYGYYWSSSIYYDGAYSVDFYSASVNPNFCLIRTNGFSVRCIAESTPCAAASIQSTTPALRDTTICSGGTATLTVNATGSVTYEWFNSSNASVGTNATFTTSAAGTYYCVITPTCGGATANSGNFTVTINSVPATPGTISGNTPLCVPASAQTYSITAVPNTTSYTWTNPGTGWSGTSTTNSISLTPSATAISGNITVTANNACGSSAASTLAVVTNVTPALPTFMAYNLGADPTLNTPALQMAYLANNANGTAYTTTSHGRVFGGRYQWGRQNLAYAINPSTYLLYVSTNSVALPGGATYDTDGQIIGQAANHVYNASSPYDWRGTGTATAANVPGQWNALWGNGEAINTPTPGTGAVLHTDGNYYQRPVKTGNDPCPAGFRLPTQNDWELMCNYDCNPTSAGGTLAVSASGIYQATSGLTWVKVRCGGNVCNISTATLTSSDRGGYAVYNTAAWDAAAYTASDDLITGPSQPLLFLPAAGYRSTNNGTGNYVGTDGYYWSSSSAGTGAYSLHFNSTYVYSNYNIARAAGFSVRCVTE